MSNIINRCTVSRATFQNRFEAAFKDLALLVEKTVSSSGLATRFTVKYSEFDCPDETIRTYLDILGYRVQSCCYGEACFSLI